MAETGFVASTPPVGHTPPIAFMVAIWLGMPHQDIERGLADGSIARPPGAPADWQPSWAPTADGSSGNGTMNPTLPEDVDPSAGDGADPPTAAPDRATIDGWLRALDPTLSAASFERIWEAAGADDDARAGTLFGYLRRTLLGDDGDAAAAPGNTASDTAARAQDALSTYLANPGHRARIAMLADVDGADLARLAKSDIGVRYALAHFDSIALTANRALFAQHNADGALDRFDADTGDANISDAWLADRARFLAWKLKLDGGGDATIAGDEGWVFVDRTARDAAGDPLRLEIAGADGSTRRHQVIFGDDDADGEMLRGGPGTDRIYGGGGDDVVRGRAGNDHLEGGSGSDLLLGGAGNDELAGGQGDDELEGGSGNDALVAGAGDDTLTGGTGADRMEGGSGFDTYVIDSGDGADTIVDSDGQGELRFDGETLAGIAMLKDGRYTSADGKAIFSFAGDAEEGGTLTISFYENPNPGENDRPINNVRIRGWKNGDLGILLVANEAVAGEAPGNDGDGGSAGTGAADSAGEKSMALANESFGRAESTPALVNPDLVQRAMRAFIGVAEAPDITATVPAWYFGAFGVTAHDLASATMDFHDASDGGNAGAGVLQPVIAGIGLEQSRGLDALAITAGAALDSWLPRATGRKAP